MVLLGTALAFISIVLAIATARGIAEVLSGAWAWFGAAFGASLVFALVESVEYIYRRAVCDYYASANLERHMHEAGLGDVQARTYLAHATSLDQHPFWRLFLLAQIPLFAHAGLISEDDGQRFAADQEELSRRGEFSAACIIRTAVATKPG